MDLIKESFSRLYPKKELTHQTRMEYNRRLGAFNANISYSPYQIKVNLNLGWKDIDDEIKIGLIQSLLLKVFKKDAKRSTHNIVLYNNFLKNIPILTPKTKTDPTLFESYLRLNETFFSGILEMPNLVWGRESFRKLACYNFHNDTVTVSTIFRDAPQEVLDYVVYHELLHKHHQFEEKNGRNSYHSRAFREDERRYPDYKLVEEKINGIIRAKKRSSQTRKRKVIKKRKRKTLWDYFKGA